MSLVSPPTFAYVLSLITLFVLLSAVVLASFGRKNADARGSDLFCGTLVALGVALFIFVPMVALNQNAHKILDEAELVQAHLKGVGQSFVEASDIFTNLVCCNNNIKGSLCKRVNVAQLSELSHSITQVLSGFSDDADDAVKVIRTAVNTLDVTTYLQLLLFVSLLFVFLALTRCVSERKMALLTGAMIVVAYPVLTGVSVVAATWVNSGCKDIHGLIDTDETIEFAVHDSPKHLPDWYVSTIRVYNDSRPMMHACNGPLDVETLANSLIGKIKPGFLNSEYTAAYHTLCVDVYVNFIALAVLSFISLAGIVVSLGLAAVVAGPGMPSYRKLGGGGVQESLL